MRPRNSCSDTAILWPLGTLDEMPVEVRDDVVKGPGVYDMKGGLAQMVFALRAMQDLGLRLTVTPIVFVNSDEEVGSKESTRHIRRLARAVERAFVMEPSLGPSGNSKRPGRGWDATRLPSRVRPRTPDSTPRRVPAQSWNSPT